MSFPIAVNTADGTCWTRRGALRGGEALYAPEGVCSCPEFVMATLAELAEHGIVGSADVLPMPVGPEPKTVDGFCVVVEVSNADSREDAVWAAELAENALEGQGFKASASVDDTGTSGLADLEGRLRVAEDRRVRALGENDALRKRLGDLGRERDTLRERVAELEAERHTTNEALSDAAEQLRVDRDRIAELEAAPVGGGYPPALPWAKHMDADDLEGFLADLADAASGDDDLTTLAAVEDAIGRWRVIGEAQHAHNTAPGPDAQTKTTADPQALRAEDTADLVTLAPAQRAEADYDAAFQTISLELTATREQWSAWQKALAVDLRRTTNRGSCTTSHATWRGIHVVIRCYLVQDGGE